MEWRGVDFSDESGKGEKRIEQEKRKKKEEGGKEERNAKKRRKGKGAEEMSCVLRIFLWRVVAVYCLDLGRFHLKTCTLFCP